ncbi:MAG: hypothetical protein RRB13_11855 [bacterium]|nr:hypothetical protein [bacterium]
MATKNDFVERLEDWCLLAEKLSGKSEKWASLLKTFDFQLFDRLFHHRAIAKLEKAFAHQTHQVGSGPLEMMRFKEDRQNDRAGSAQSLSQTVLSLGVAGVSVERSAVKTDQKVKYLGVMPPFWSRHKSQRAGNLDPKAFFLSLFQHTSGDTDRPIEQSSEGFQPANFLAQVRVGSAWGMAFRANPNKQASFPVGLSISTGEGRSNKALEDFGRSFEANLPVAALLPVKKTQKLLSQARRTPQSNEHLFERSPQISGLDHFFGSQPFQLAPKLPRPKFSLETGARRGWHTKLGFNQQLLKASGGLVQTISGKILWIEKKVDLVWASATEGFLEGGMGELPHQATTTALVKNAQVGSWRPDRQENLIQNPLNAHQPVVQYHIGAVYSRSRNVAADLRREALAGG